MDEFIVELYASREHADALDRAVERLRAAADELTGAGTPVRYVRRLFVARDETCLLLCEAESADAVREAARRAGVAFERVSDVTPEAGHSNPNR